MLGVVSSVLMLLCGGLFAGGVLTLAWNRLPAWRGMERSSFADDFGRAINVADRLQPFLLVIAILAGAVFALNSEGLAQGLAIAAIVGFLLTLVLSLAILVPLQRRILATYKEADDFEAMRARWLQGHTGRTVVSLISFLLAVIAVSVR